MEFLKENIHKAAIDYARKKNNNEIVDLLSASKIKTSKEEEETKEKK